MKLYSWNVNGIRAVEKKGFAGLVAQMSPDILCLQETKASEDQLSDELKNIPGYTSVWCSGERKGYSGVATFFKTPPVKTVSGFGLDPCFDCEGRILISEHQHFTLLNIYFPNGQRDDERLQYKLRFYEATLEYCEKRRQAGRPLVICGDVNTAHNEIDIARPKENEKTSGFLRIERDWMDKFESFGYIDTFRKLHPVLQNAYSWWSPWAGARARNVGWRLDYFYVTPDQWTKVKGAAIHPAITGSDHCPVSLELDL
ncbi:MAG: exodeoxyribonuclease III [Victivallaceae bacterium]|jgi:exodeoxyribonuclease-3